MDIDETFVHVNHQNISVSTVTMFLSVFKPLNIYFNQMLR